MQIKAITFYLVIYVSFQLKTLIRLNRYRTMSSSLTDKIRLENTPNHTDDVEVQMESLDVSSENMDDDAFKEVKPPKKNVFKSKIFIIAITFSSVLVVAMCIGFIVHYELGGDITDTADVPFWKVDLPAEQELWYNKGIEELRRAVTREINLRRAKNVILFVGDGMGPNTVTASRIYGFKEEGLMAWEKFPSMGMLKVSSAKADSLCY